tara:strand:+ start:295 stop:483 length:189 start_codon:yes stop_codon:yes gene_type:complete
VVDSLVEVQDIYMVVVELALPVVKIIVDQVEMVEQEFAFQDVFLLQFQQLLVVEDQEVTLQE